MNWDGQFDSDTICIDDSNEKFWVLEQLLIKPAIYKVNENESACYQLKGNINMGYRLTKK